MTRSPGYVALR